MGCETEKAALKSLKMTDEISNKMKGFFYRNLSLKRKSFRAEKQVVLGCFF